MRMVTLQFLSTVICAVFIATGAVSGVNLCRTVGDQVSFRPDKPLTSSIVSIIWKHNNSVGIVVKAIEWDEGKILIPNLRFKNITTVDEKTGEITVTNLKVEHSGVYSIDIDSKEQEQRFTLTVMEPVPQPVIKIEQSDNNDVVYLRCEYSENIIWMDSTGKILQGSKITPKGESLTVQKNGNLENFYTCTLKNCASNKTSERVYSKDVFKAGSITWLIVCIIIILLIIIAGVLVFLYKRQQKFKEFVNGCCPCLRATEAVQTASPGPQKCDDNGVKGEAELLNK